MQQVIHFTTQNAPLAEALTVVGFKLLDIWNVYTDARLDSIGMPTVATAKENGKPGILTYVFERTTQLQDALAAWDATGEHLKKNDPKLITALQIPEDRIEDAIALVRFTMFAHKPFHALWRGVPALYKEEKGGEPTETVEPRPDLGEGWSQRVVTLPGFKVVSDNVSEEDRNKIIES